MYTYNLGLKDLHNWLENASPVGVDSVKVKNFTKESLDILKVNDPTSVELFGIYLESKKRLKLKDGDNFIQNISWENYLQELCSNSSILSMPFEVILFIYSYCGGGHFGNDYGIVSDINKIRQNNNLSQITEHNQDFTYEVEEKSVQFQRVILVKNKWSLSHKMYKVVNTLPELYIILGRNKLKSAFEVLSG